MGTVHIGILLKVILICAAPVVLKGLIQLVGISPLVFIVVLLIWGSTGVDLRASHSFEKKYAFGISSQ
jgi:hypothetical protein